MAIYMKIDGFKGSATAKGHENWIELVSADFNITRGICTRTGNPEDREGGIPSFKELLLTKKTDRSSPELFQQACSGDAIPTVDLEMCGTSNDLQPHIKLKLSDVIISQYSSHMHMVDSMPVEKLKLNFAKIEKTFIPRDSQNKPQSPITAGYDLTTAKTL